MPDNNSLELNIEKELEVYEKEVEELDSKRKELQNRKTELKQKIEQRQKQLQQELDPLIPLLEQYTLEVKELEDNKQEFENTIENKQETLADIRERREKLETVLNKYKKGYVAKKEKLHAQVRDNIRAKIQQIQKLKLKNSELESERDELEPEYRDLEKQRQEIEARLSELRPQLETLNSQTSELQTNLEKAEQGKKDYTIKARTVIASSKEKIEEKIREKKESLAKLIATDNKESETFEKEEKQNQIVTKQLSEKKNLLAQTQSAVDEKTKYMADLTKRMGELGTIDSEEYQPSLKATKIAEDAIKSVLAPEQEDLTGLEEAMLKPADLKPAKEDYTSPPSEKTLPEELEPAPQEEAALEENPLDSPLKTEQERKSDQLINFIDQFALDTPSQGREFSDIREDEAEAAIDGIAFEEAEEDVDSFVENGLVEMKDPPVENSEDDLVLPIEDLPREVIYLDDGVELSPLLKDYLNEKIPEGWVGKTEIIPLAEICYKNQDLGDISIQFIDGQAFLETVKDYAHQMIISSTRQIMDLDEIENPEIDSEERLESFSHSWSRIKKMLALFFENYNPSVETAIGEYSGKKKVDDNLIKFADIESGKGMVMGSYLQAFTRRVILPTFFEEDQIIELYKGTLTEQPSFRPTINLGKLVNGLTSEIKQLTSPDYQEKVSQTLEALGFLLDQRGYTISKAD